jgi:signal peptide peptidase SppA
METKKKMRPMISDSTLMEFQNELWLMEPRALDALFRKIALAESLPFQIVGVKKPQEVESKMKVEGDTASIPVRGVLMKVVPAIFQWFGIEATSYQQIEADIKSAMENEDVKKIVLNIESPGGMVSGSQEAAAAIYSASKSKSVDARIEDMGTSGAYLLASQAPTITANPNAAIGSIGVYQVLYDYSKMAENEGIKTYVIKSGPHKGAGVPGSVITEEQLAAIQGVINTMADSFVEFVARGRNKPKEDIKALATGEYWLAEKAKELGLIDNVVLRNASESNSNRSLGMGDTKNEVVTEKVEKVDIEAIKAETRKQELDRLQQIKASFPDDIAFAMEQYAKGATVDQAKVAYCDVLAAKNKALQAELASKQSSKSVASGTEAIAHNEAAVTSNDFMAVCEAYAEANKCSKGTAIKAIAKDQPELHQQWIESREPRRIKRR